MKNIFLLLILLLFLLTGCLTTTKVRPLEKGETNIEMGTMVHSTGNNGAGDTFSSSDSNNSYGERLLLSSISLSHGFTENLTVGTTLYPVMGLVSLLGGLTWLPDVYVSLKLTEQNGLFPYLNLNVNTMNFSLIYDDIETYFGFIEPGIVASWDLNEYVMAYAGTSIIPGVYTNSKEDGFSIEGPDTTLLVKMPIGLVLSYGSMSFKLEGQNVFPSLKGKLSLFPDENTPYVTAFFASLNFTF